MKVFDGDDTNEQQNTSCQGELKDTWRQNLVLSTGRSHTDDLDAQQKTKNP